MPARAGACPISSRIRVLQGVILSRKESPMARAIPDFDKLLGHFPRLKSPEVKKLIGGELNHPNYVNACVMRLSRSLNLSGHPLPRHATGMIVKKGGDGLWYGVRVPELRKYLTATYGPAHVSAKLYARKVRGTTAPKSFEGMRGILVFEGGLSGATGHATLWDGYKAADDAYWGADEAHLWGEQNGKVISIRAPV